MDTLLIILPVALLSLAMGMVYGLYRQILRCTKCRIAQEEQFENEVNERVNRMTIKEFLTRIGRDAGY